MLPRQCSKVTCVRDARSTLTYDYEGSVMALGPLSPVPAPHSYDLCAEHAGRLTAPAGWELLRHNPNPERGAEQSAG
ncbi:DUF3499 family protein [Leucobacter sp. M11]|uniref:DUF3499 family protein n=1 Tax=Leucobacter sp. M11 TaxID=2993565 RepID=UPI002D802CB6|nr:DUF3499 family protein [Leucobacter sp. M11]MEB4615446.1 DUF3499 family protein [Leucobacter sp. M11]